MEFNFKNRDFLSQSKPWKSLFHIVNTPVTQIILNIADPFDYRQLLPDLSSDGSLVGLDIMVTLEDTDTYNLVSSKLIRYLHVSTKRKVDLTVFINIQHLRYLSNFISIPEFFLLKKVEIICCDITEASCFGSSVETLVIEYCEFFSSVQGLGNVPFLTIEGCGCLEDISALTNNIIVHLVGCSKIKEFCCFKGNENLKEICIESNTFLKDIRFSPNLQRLKINRCENVNRINSLPTQLSKLELREMNSSLILNSFYMLSNLFHVIVAKSFCFADVSMLGNISVLELARCPNLTSLQGFW
jgi:hypothetical protein